MKSIVLLTSRSWNEYLAPRLSEELGCQVHLITKKEDLTLEKLSLLKPEWIFVPHWSFLIPREIYQNFKCVIFHMTDLPYGRGGSPLQNLIRRGHKETKLSALLCEQDVDAGPIYLKRSLSLEGTAQEIFARASLVIKDMVVEIFKKNITPLPQTGEPVFFTRLKPEDGSIAALESTSKVYDYIRMLDADGYPKAFITLQNFTLEFSEASFKDGVIEAKVVIKEKI